ncbi:ABC-type transporter, integral membrane subunit [Microbacterium laevaniformans OR221]|nr:ABC-type transporter, integral membrane subunit [Microbacterium laevaniformans OR221]
MTISSGLKKPNFQRRERAWGLLFVAPISAQVILFTLIPVVIAAFAGFTDWSSISGITGFVGLDNFAEFLGDKYFWIAAGNTIVMLLPIPIYLIFGVLLALGSHRGTPGSTLFRILFFLPYVSSIVALVVLWKWLFNYQYGLINQGLALIGIQGPDWLGDPAWIKTTIVIMIAWKMIGITSIYILAALKNIPISYYEAARLDGASTVRVFFQITLPMLTPALFFLVIVGIIGSLQTFVEVQLFTSDGGQDYSAATVTYYIWQKAFSLGELGLASAAALFFAVVILAATLFQFWLSRRWVYEGE